MARATRTSLMPLVSRVSLAEAGALSYVGLHVTRGSLIGLAAGGAAGVVAIILVAVLAVRGCGNDEAPAAPAAGPNAAARAGTEGMGAKGTAELRALGCNNALVVDMQRLLGPTGKVRPGEPRYMVTCDVNSAEGAP